MEGALIDLPPFPGETLLSAAFFWSFVSLFLARDLPFFFMPAGSRGDLAYEDWLQKADLLSYEEASLILSPFLWLYFPLYLKPNNCYLKDLLFMA